MSKKTFPDPWITRIGHLRAEIQQIIDIWWPFWIMQIRCFPILGFLRTFSMVFWGPHRNSLWQQQKSVTICSKWNLTLPGLLRDLGRECTYVSRYLCSPVPMFPEHMFPGAYVPRYLCSPVPMFPGFCTLIVVISINRLQILPTPWYDSRLGLYLGFRFRVLVRVRVRVRLEL